MSTLSVDRWLAVLVAGVLATGLLTLRAGAPSEAVVFTVHGLIAAGLAAAIAMKLRRSVPAAARARRWRALAASSVIAVVAVGALVGGFAWVAAGRLIVLGPVTLLTAHAWLGLALVPALLVHLVPRRWRVLRWNQGQRGRSDRPGPSRLQRISRRALISGAVLGAVGVVTWSIPELLDRWSGGRRRFTGSRLLSAGESPPATTFVGEPTPALDIAAWRLRVTGRIARPIELDAGGLQTADRSDLAAVLDCTSGWAIDGTWSGVPLAALLDRATVSAEAEAIVVRSMTGWSTRLTLEDARACLLATHLDGTALDADHGAPCRLVAPMRRGLDWVKWIDEIRVA